MSELAPLAVEPSPATARGPDESTPPAHPQPEPEPGEGEGPQPPAPDQTVETLTGRVLRIAHALAPLMAGYSDLQNLHSLYACTAFQAADAVIDALHLPPETRGTLIKTYSARVCAQRPDGLAVIRGTVDDVARHLLHAVEDPQMADFLQLVQPPPPPAPEAAPPAA